MFHHRLRTFVLGAFIGISAGWAGCCGSGRGAEPLGTLSVWTENVANKVQPTTVPATTTTIAIAGPRSSWEAAQIVVRGVAGVLHKVNLEASDLSDGAGHTLARTHVTFFRQVFIDYTGVVENEPGNVRAPKESPTSDPFVPDPLIPFVDPYTGSPAGAPFDVSTDRNQPVWVDVFVPEDTVAGTYQGTITVSAEGQADVAVPITVEVWDLVLPDMQSVPNWFGTGVDEVTRYHSGTSYDGQNYIAWTARSREVVKRYEELAHAHRMDTGQTFVPQPIAPSDESCGIPTDWSAYDAAVAPYMDGTYFSDGVPSTRISVPFHPGAPSRYEQKCTDEEYKAVAGAWAEHLEEKKGKEGKSWMSRAIAYSLDEPGAEYYDDIVKDASLMQLGDPDWKAQILVTTAPTPASVPILNSVVGIYCVCLRCYNGNWTLSDFYGRKEWPALFGAGIRLWFYESNAQSDPYPTFAANTLLGLEPRMMMWGSWYEHASGFLLWDTMYWDPADKPWGPNVRWGKTGDGVLMYPGNHDGLAAPAGSPADVKIDGPIPSYRMKMVRSGLQDWALFRMAEAHDLGALARTQVERVYGQMGGCDWSGCPKPENGSFFWNPDGLLMDEIRRQVAQAIIEGGGP